MDKYYKEIKKMDKAFFDKLISDMIMAEWEYKANQTVENERLMDLARLEFLLNDERIDCFTKIIMHQDKEKEIIEKFRPKIEELKNKMMQLM